MVAATTTATNVPRFAVDYSDTDSMIQIFKDNNVEVVVSALLLADQDVANSQINLIRAAAGSGTVTKFIPSEFYIDFHKPIPGSDLFTNFQLEAEAELLRHPQLSWTLIRCGIFLDHLTMPYNPKRTYISPFWVFVDLDHEKCVFPGDGSQPLVLTHSTDLAACIERLVGLPAQEWPRESLVASNRLQVRDLAALIQKVTGKKFQVTYDPVEAIHRGYVTPLPSNQGVFSDPAKGELLHQVELQVMLSMLSHAHDLPGKDLLELFPDVQTTKLEQFLREGWEIKQSQ
ncbi:nmrA-like family [Pyrenophora seminiperda CCB06]|uniref:NmrA-like family n=1 Tax=Pyrenophora seminiperda CCB06 TaxID=1302712 RepID=A0A3M7MGB2_9PLEO|nr:nmrA-like family [Pyrenophora seminiperda CCB06]